MPTFPGEENLVLPKGEILFEQGDVGGDLFIIQQGQIDIYTVKEGHDVSLTIMQQGEVIGLLSCMTREPRLASARAHSNAVVRKVKYESITGLIKSLPTWMKVILKEFNLRINQMNRMYSECVKRIKYLQANQISRLYTSAQMASAIASCAEAKKVMIDDVPAVIPEEILDLIESFLCRPRPEIDAIFGVFVDMGMIKLQIEKDKKRKYFTLANAQKLKTFSEFVEQSGRGKVRRLLQTKFAHKEQRILTALVRYAVAMKLDIKGTVELAVKDLRTSLKTVTGQDFDLGALEQPEALELLTLEGEPPTQKVCFVPASLNYTLTHLTVYQRLEKLEEAAINNKK